MPDIKYYLQPIHVTPDPNDQSARIDYRETLYENDIISRMLKRGTMVTETDVKAVLSLFFDVVTDEVAGGSIVNLPTAKIRPSIKGVFKDTQDNFDPARHKLAAAVSPGILLLEKMRNATTQKITSQLPAPFLQMYEDINSQSSNSVLSPGGIGKIIGEELKFDQSQADEGIFLLDTSGNETKVAVIASLTEGQIMFMVPAPLASGDYTLEVRKAYTSSRAIRKGTLDEPLTVA